MASAHASDWNHQPNQKRRRRDRRTRTYGGAHDVTQAPAAGGAFPVSRHARLALTLRRPSTAWPASSVRASKACIPVHWARGGAAATIGVQGIVVAQGISAQWWSPFNRCTRNTKYGKPYLEAANRSFGNHSVTQTFR
ncbi:hypothetical protein GGX14DRAFT_387716 [Mycena pura]|uniref:Uncharacterized protein n=1 Tax=Mycena pura TaxID=153505 RepID=A0AAD6YMF0_9AGAR|nr:hypothetical protein GGX14DRAFT_387716 [Mycena pura]